MSKRNKGPRARRPRSGGGKLPEHDGAERLQKLLARAGYGSRRACEAFIVEGRVTVDGETVTELGARAHPGQDIRVDGGRVKSESLVYYLVNKPRGVVCTSHDPQGRRTILDLLPQERRRVFSVGRLDYESRGAVILTNDGRLTNLLTHPRYGIEKTYQVRVRGQVDDEALERLRSGIWLSEGRTLPAEVSITRRRRGETELRLTICEGKNRQVRRMFAKTGHKVLGLTRTRIGPLSLKGLGDSDLRTLKAQEVEMLIRLAQRNAEAPAPRRAVRQSRRRSLGKPDPASPPVLGSTPARASTSSARASASSRSSQRGGAPSRRRAQRNGTGRGKARSRGPRS